MDTKPPIGEAGAHQVTRHLVSSPRASKEQVVKPKGDEDKGSPGLVRWWEPEGPPMRARRAPQCPLPDLEVRAHRALNF